MTRDELDGCELDMTAEETTWERLAVLLGESNGEPPPDKTEDEHELRHRPR